MGVHVCYENVFALQLHVEGIEVRSMCPSAGLGERAITGRRTDQRREDSSDEERWRSPSAGHAHETARPLDSASELLAADFKLFNTPLAFPWTTPMSLCRWIELVEL